MTGIFEEEIGGGVLATALVAAITPRTSGPGRVVCVGGGGGGGGGSGATELPLVVAASSTSLCLAAAIQKSSVSVVVQWPHEIKVT